MGSLYPFARNHNDNESISQEPYALGKTVLQSAYNNLKLRYSLLKHYYTVFIQNEGLTPVLRPLFVQFPLDDNCWKDEVAETQLLIGASLMSTPILTQGATSRYAYFHGENGWFDLATGRWYSQGYHLVEDVDLTHTVPLFLKAGALILRQDTEGIRSTRQLSNHF